MGTHMGPIEKLVRQLVRAVPLTAGDMEQWVPRNAAGCQSIDQLLVRSCVYLEIFTAPV